MSTVHTLEHVKRQVRVYVYVFLSLLVLTIVTVLVSRIELPVLAGVIVALIVASFKGTLVAGIFMHLFSDKSPFIVRVLIVSAFLFFVMIALFLFGYFDTFASSRAVVEATTGKTHH